MCKITKKHQNQLNITETELRATNHSRLGCLRSGRGRFHATLHVFAAQVSTVYSDLDDTFAYIPDSDLGRKSYPITCQCSQI